MVAGIFFIFFLRHRYERRHGAYLQAEPKLCTGVFAFMCVCAVLLGLERVLAGIVGKRPRRFPAAEHQKPQSPNQ